MSKNPQLVTSVLVVLFTTFLSGCQSNNENATPEVSAPENACEKSKKSWDYNTAGGRALAKITCSGKTYPDYKSYNQAAWREHTRQRQCKQDTGKFCED